MAAFFLGKGGFKSEEEKLTEDLFPKLEEMGSMPELKYVPVPEAEEKLQVAAQVNKDHWERLGALSVEVKVKNVSDQTLLRSVVIRTLFDKSGKVVGVKTRMGQGLKSDS